MRLNLPLTQYRIFHDLCPKIVNATSRLVTINITNSYIPKCVWGLRYLNH